MDKPQESLRHLFQQEFTRLVAVISRKVGLQHLELAEDIVGETFLLAAETWGVRGVPPNPTAWLYVVAKQKLHDHFRRHKLLTDKIMPELTAQQSLDEPGETNIDFSEQGIRDSQLRMLFAVCTPVIAADAQIGLALRILCGFGIDEIAQAFLTSKETVNKRLCRAKKKLRQTRASMELPPDTLLVHRLDRVLRVIYLLFNEGYYSRTQNQPLRQELCLEAMRLALLLTDYPQTNQPATNALLALMCFHASRFEARQPVAGATATETPVLYDEQNESLWDMDLIRRGFDYLRRSMQGPELSAYHLEARIASWHCVNEDSAEKWASVLHLYDQLLLLNHSPNVALNRLYALARVNGQPAALAEAQTLNLSHDHLYYVLLGDLSRTIDPTAAVTYFQRAHALAKTQSDRQAIQHQLDRLGPAGDVM